MKSACQHFLLITLYLLLCIAPSVFAQPRGNFSGGEITGRVSDLNLQTPIEYANVVLYSVRDSSQVTGTVTDSEGTFRLADLRGGRFYLTVDFIGYQTETVNDIRVFPQEPRADLGDIYLKQAVLAGEEVTVSEERAPVEFKIDKKIVNVAQNFTAASGSAVDALENVPSVSVDIEGNVSLRGSENFKVLVDNMPSPLEGSEALQQIPASSIEHIEIITNPSAKYDPEGTAGIINVIMKKGKKAGINGVFNLNGGQNDQQGGDFLLNYRQDKTNYYIGANYDERGFPGSVRNEKEWYTQQGTLYTNSAGIMDRGRDSYGIRGGINLTLSQSDYLNLNVRYGGRSGERDFITDYVEWNDWNDDRLTYESNSHRERSGDYYSANADYKHQFHQDGHELTARASFRSHDSDEETTDERQDADGSVVSGNRAVEEGPSDDWEFQLDYVLPWANGHKLEAGTELELETSDDRSEQLVYVPAEETYVVQPEYSHNTGYDRTIQATYALYSYDQGKFGFLTGLRAEYTDRRIELNTTGEKFTIDRWDYFPSAHLSYQLTDKQQLMASYTRRIDRPRGWMLEPFETRIDAYNVRRGNPALEPEYIDSFEMNYQIGIGKYSLFAESYYRVTDNKSERIQSAYDDNVTLHTYENVGKDYALGLEMGLRTRLFSWLDINYTGNVYDYRIEGELYGEPFERDSFNWDTRFNHMIKLNKRAQVQINGFYFGPRSTAQGEDESFAMVNAAVKYEFIPKVLSATLQVRDVFSNMKHEGTSEGQGFYSYRLWEMDTPMVMLNLTYTLNNYKPDRERRGGDNGGMDDGEMDAF